MKYIIPIFTLVCSMLKYTDTNGLCSFPKNQYYLIRIARYHIIPY